MRRGLQLLLQLRLSLGVGLLLGLGLLLVRCLQCLGLLTVGFFQGLPLGHGLLKFGGGLRTLSRSLPLLRLGLRLLRL